jgi:hypothetical protein
LASYKDFTNFKVPFSLPNLAVISCQKQYIHSLPCSAYTDDYVTDELYQSRDNDDNHYQRASKRMSLSASSPLSSSTASPPTTPASPSLKEELEPDASSFAEKKFAAFRLK